MKRAALLLICFVFLISSVSAALINTTILIPTDYSGQVSINQASDTSAYSFEPSAGNVIVFQNVGMSGSGFLQNTPIIFKLYRADNTIITGNITTTTGYLSGEVVSSFNGGTTSSSGSNFFNIRQLISPVNLVYLYSNSTGLWYLALVEAGRVNYAPFAATTKNLGSLDLDDSADAYITLSGNPSSNPIIKTDYSSQMMFYIQTSYESGQALVTHETNTNYIGTTKTLPQSGDWVGKLLEIIGAVLSAGYQILVLATTLATYVITGIAFLFLAQIFLTLIAGYTILALVFSFYDSDDLFKSIGKFWKYEMRLARFFMEIFRWGKDIIKWW